MRTARVWRLARRLCSAFHPGVLVAVLLACGCKAPGVDNIGPSGGGTGGKADAAATSGAGFDAAASDLPFTFQVPDAGANPEATPATVATEPDCTTAAQQRGNAGCTFYPTEVPLTPGYDNSCFAVFVVNPSSRPALLTLERGGAPLPLAALARIPQGAGKALTYAPYDPALGIPPGQVAMLFLAGTKTSKIPCPAGVTPAAQVTTSLVDKSALAVSGTGKAFRLASDRPVVAYQITPYSGGGVYGVTSATILLPRESWGTSHFLATPTDSDRALVMVTAGEDDTEVTLRPTTAILGATGIAATAPGNVVTVHIGAGDFVQFAATGGSSSLSGSVVSASKPVGVISGASQFFSNGFFSSAQQQILPVEALGNEYVAIKHRNRAAADESEAWQIVGAADGTTLTYLPAAPTGAPVRLNAGQVVEWKTKAPFIVRSQDADHPFELFAYMTGDQVTGDLLGDPEFVNVVATGQYVSSYTLFTDPTYGETSLVVVRKRGQDGKFADVRLGCAATPLADFMPVGDFEYTRVSLVTTDLASRTSRRPVAGCDSGRLTMQSANPFSVTVWGWDSGVSYAYPGGSSTVKISNVKPPIIK